MPRWLRPAILALALLGALPAVADVFRPAYLELREAGPDRYDVFWKVPAAGELRLAVAVRFPNDVREIGRAPGQFIGGAYVERWQVERAGGLVGQTIAIEGAATGVSDVIARVERADGTSQVERLSMANPRFTVEAPAGTAEIAWSYLVLGVEHILGGVDHLLFVLALLLVAVPAVLYLRTHRSGGWRQHPLLEFLGWTLTAPLLIGVITLTMPGIPAFFRIGLLFPLAVELAYLSAIAGAWIAMLLSILFGLDTVSLATG